MVRAPKFRQAKEIYERVVKIAQGAAMMTGTTFETFTDSGYSDYLPNETIGRLMSDIMNEIGAWQLDEDDIRFAKKIGATLTQEQKWAADSRIESDTELEVIRKNGVASFTVPYRKSDLPMPGSTDVGDVRWNTPTARLTAATQVFGTSGHSWQVVAQGKSGLCHKGMLLAAKTIALTTAELFERPELVEQAKAEWKKTLNGEKYLCPIPTGVKPAALR